MLEPISPQDNSVKAVDSANSELSKSTSKTLRERKRVPAGPDCRDAASALVAPEYFPMAKKTDAAPA